MVVPDGAGHQERRLVAGQAKAEADEVERLLVAPLDVVQDQEQRAAHRDQRPRQPLIEAVPLPRVRHRARPWIDTGNALVRQQPRDFRSPRRVEGRRGRSDRRIAQPVGDRGKRQPPRRREALGSHHDRALPTGQIGDLGHQAGLPHAGAARDKHHAAPPGGRRLPDAGQDAQLVTPPDKRRPGLTGPPGRPWRLCRLRAHGRAVPAWRRRPVTRHEPPERRAGRVVGCHAKLPLKHGGAMVVGAHRRRPVAHVGKQPHQHAIPGLLKGLQLDAAPRGGRRPGEIAGPRPGGADQVAQLHALPSEPFPRLGGPVVVHARQQVAAVLRKRLGAVPDHRVVVAGLRGRECRQPAGIECPHVRVTGRPVHPAQVPGRDLQRAVLAKHLAQVMQFAAQVGQCLRVAGFRPQQAGDPLARDVAPQDARRGRPPARARATTGPERRCPGHR